MQLRAVAVQHIVLNQCSVLWHRHGAAVVSGLSLLLSPTSSPESGERGTSRQCALFSQWLSLTCKGQPPPPQSRGRWRGAEHYGRNAERMGERIGICRWRGQSS